MVMAIWAGTPRVATGAPALTQARERSRRRSAASRASLAGTATTGIAMAA